MHWRLPTFTYRRIQIITDANFFPPINLKVPEVSVKINSPFQPLGKVTKEVSESSLSATVTVSNSVVLVTAAPGPRIKPRFYKLAEAFANALAMVQTY